MGQWPDGKVTNIQECTGAHLRRAALERIRDDHTDCGVDFPNSDMNALKNTHSIAGLGNRPLDSARIFRYLVPMIS